MRKYQQTQIMESVRTLEEAHDSLRQLITKGDLPTLVQLLGDCQAIAIKIGTYIEQIAGEGTETVGLLEEYCELLYQLGVEAEAGSLLPKAIKKLQRQMNRVATCVTSELRPNRLEVVFIPYKLAMWDSLESIWLAAREDPQCDAYVVPIPYYEKNRDGSLGQMHYEGDLYPEDVHVTDWRQYSIADRHPDIIFTHNPYDNANFVTNVHPDFYNKRLHELTDLLVYVPYFVTQHRLEKHFSRCAGTIISHKVMVQSEKIRQEYIRGFNMLRSSLSAKELAKLSEERFVALGSPKFDKVFNSCPGDFELPPAWARLREKPGGGEKKVVLYNTSVGALLNSGENMLHKLRAVFDYFKGRDDLLLWWRPHPLNTATYEALRWDLADGYRRLVEEYRSAGFGIYDDTPDLHRALALSDAYYGDNSSLVALYQFTGKPLMVQKWQISGTSATRDDLSVTAPYLDGGALWFTEGYFNGLFRRDMESGEAEYMGSFPGERVDGQALYRAAAGNGARLYFAPDRADRIGVYDREAGAFSGIEIPAEKGEAGQPQTRRFSQIFSYGQWVFLVPYVYSGLLRVDTQTGAVEKITGWHGELARRTGRENGPYFRDAVQVDGCLYMLAEDSNTVAVLDMEANAVRLETAGPPEGRYAQICHDGAAFWLAPYGEGDILRWEGPGGGETLYGAFPGEYVARKEAFAAIVPCGGLIWLLPREAKMALTVDPESGEIADAPAFTARDVQYESAWAMGDTLAGRVWKGGPLSSYNTRTGQRGTMATAMPQAARLALEPQVERLLEEGPGLERQPTFLLESPLLPMDRFFDDVVARAPQAEAKPSKAYMAALSANTDGTAGREIYGYCKRLAFPEGTR